MNPIIQIVYSLLGVKPGIKPREKKDERTKTAPRDPKSPSPKDKP